MNMLRYVLSGLGAAGFAIHATGVTLTWTGAANENFYDPANWSPVAVPASSDTLNVSGNVEISPPFVTTGQINWTYGVLRGALNIASNGVLALTSGYPKILAGVLTNAGMITITNSAGRFQFDGNAGAQLHTVSGSRVDVQDDITLEITGGGYAYIANGGVFRKSAGSGGCAVGSNIAFHNSGTVEALAGWISLQGGGSLSGACAATDGAWVIFNSGSFMVTPSAVFSGPGFVGVSGDTVFSGTLATTMQWYYGPIRGTWTIATNGVLALTSGYPKILAGVLTNAGMITITNSAGRFQFDGNAGAQLHTVSGSRVDVQDDITLEITGGGYAYIANGGVFRKSAGNGVCTVGSNIAFHNSGTVEALSGTLYFPSSLWNYGGGFSVRVNSDSDWGRMAFANPPTLNGSFSASLLHGYVPAVGSTFSVFTFPSVTNSFAAYNGLDLGAGRKLVPHFSRTAFSLRVSNYPQTVAPTLSIYPLPGSMLLWWPGGYSSYQVSEATNLNAPVWVPLSMTGPNQSLIAPDKPEQYFRLLR